MFGFNLFAVGFHCKILFFILFTGLIFYRGAFFLLFFSIVSLIFSCYFWGWVRHICKWNGEKIMSGHVKMVGVSKFDRDSLKLTNVYVTFFLLFKITHLAFRNVKLLTKFLNSSFLNWDATVDKKNMDYKDFGIIAHDCKGHVLAARSTTQNFVAYSCRSFGNSSSGNFL